MEASSMGDQEDYVEYEYLENEIESLLDDDELSPEEAAFMKGYDEAL